MRINKTVIVAAIALSTTVISKEKLTKKTIAKADPATCVLEPLSQSGIGDVKYSILSETDFQAVNGTEWVLLDGSALNAINYGSYDSSNGTIADVMVTASEYEDSTKLPDASGKFLRMTNTLNGTNQNPDNLKMGQFQNDAFQGHNHRTMGTSWVSQGVLHGAAASGSLGSENNIIGGPISDGVNGTPRVASETRPKSITVNAFVKVRRACINDSVNEELKTIAQNFEELKCGPADKVTYPSGCFELPETNEVERHAKATCLKIGLDEWEADNNKKFWTHNCLVQTVSTAKRNLLALGASRTADEETWFNKLISQYPYYNEVETEYRKRK